MKGLQPPPKEDTPSRIVGRFVMLILLAGASGVAIYTAVTNQRVDLTEDIRTVGLELEDPSEVGGLTINVREDPGGSTPVVLLHDADSSGGMILSDLSSSLGEGYRGVRIDFPGFGLSDRIPSIGPWYTAAGMADIISAVLESRFDTPVVIVGIGFGGEVGADLALTYPNLVSGLVMVDVVFEPDSGFPLTLERLPWVGKAATYTWETGGRFALDTWAPYCETGGWCPTIDQLSQREFMIEIENTTDSFYSYLRTEAAALAPANLEDITIPVAYVWSSEGGVPEDAVDEMSEEIASFTMVESATFQAHLEDPAAVSSALAAVAP